MKTFCLFVTFSAGFLLTDRLYAEAATNAAASTPAPADSTPAPQPATVVPEPAPTPNEKTALTSDATPPDPDASGKSDANPSAFDKSPYVVILEKMPFGIPPDPNALTTAANGSSEAAAKAEQDKATAICSWTALNITPEGKAAVGFTDLSAKPPASYYLTAGESESNWKVIEVDYASEMATFEKDGIRFSLKFGSKSPLTSATPSPGGPGALQSQPIPGLTVAGHAHGQPMATGTTSPSDTHTPGLAPGLTRPGFSGSAGGQSSFFTSYRDRLNERMKAQEKQKLESEQKKKEELSEIVKDAIRKQQEEAAAAAAAQQPVDPQGTPPSPQIEVQVQ